MKHKKYIKLSKYRSALATTKRRRSEALFEMLKKILSGEYLNDPSFRSVSVPQRVAHRYEASDNPFC